MTTDRLIVANNLYRYYGLQCAVKDVSLTLARGEVLGLLGPNGAGKSSTLQMLSGNLVPSGGQITVCGIDLLEAPKRAKRSLGYLPEKPPLYLDMTVDEYLHFCAALHRLPPRTINAAVDDTKQRCGLADTGRRLIGNLSKGYRQRVGVTQAIIHRPAVVILDEPTVGLDPVQIHEIRELIRELGRDQGLILSTHSLPEVSTLCDRVQILIEGRMAFDRRLDQLETNHDTATVVAAFDAPPPIETLTALAGVQAVEALGAERFRIVGEDLSLTERLVTQAVEQGWRLRELRPQHTNLEQIFMNLAYRESEEGTE
jgi:ABC-2 type transport system ATP-binding protein